jgi:hypothetical protein
VRTTGSSALWFRYNKLDGHFATIVRFNGGSLSFQEVDEFDKFKAHNSWAMLRVRICVVVGVTKDNFKEMGES